MKTKNGHIYKTVVDAASELNISVDTLRRYIRSGTLPRPKIEFFGQIGVKVFSEDYLNSAKATLAELRRAADPHNAAIAGPAN